MHIKDINPKDNILIFDIFNYDSDNTLDWLIAPASETIIPDSEDFLVVKGLIVKANKPPIPCYLTICTPERIVDFVIYNFPNPKVSKMYGGNFKNGEVILAVPAHCFGLYELFYSKFNPAIGISVLENGLKQYPNDSIMSLDLAYILRDEKRYEASLEAFLNSIKNGEQTTYEYWEIASIYKQLGQDANYKKYLKLFKTK